MTNKNAIILGSIILVVGFATSSYYLFSLSKQQKQQNLFARKKECAMQGEAYHKRNEQDFEKTNKETKMYLPGLTSRLGPYEYTYDEKLNTCLYYFSSSMCEQKGECSWSRFIINIANNQEIIEDLALPNSSSKWTPENIRSTTAFDGKYKELFTQ